MKSIKRYFSTVVIIMLLSTLLMSLGCGSMPWKKKNEQPPPVELLDETKTENTNTLPGEGTTLVPGPQRFKDVPLPDKVKEDFDRSYVYESSTLQVGRMVYSIRADANDVAQFYVKECPKYGWKLDNVIQGDGVQLNYSKEGKKLQVNVRPQGIGRPKQLVLILTPSE
ncbi:MAG: hypothetical protein ACP5UA_09255 [Candidatus Hydrogenedens sp.]